LIGYQNFNFKRNKALDDRAIPLGNYHQPQQSRLLVATLTKYSFQQLIK